MPLQHLKKYWGYDRFRPLQEEIIQNILTGNHTFVMLPTGGGKSICYQIPAVMMEGFCLVISPLVALMHDQVARLKSMGISATYFHSAQSKRELEVELTSLRNGKYKLAYISPERLQSEQFKSHLPHLNISFLAVDEAHCVSQWGYDFRPAYLQIAGIFELKPNLKIMALTATATQTVRLDIIQKLGIEQCETYQTTFYRPNLSYRIQHSFDKRTTILNQCLQSHGSGIVYAGTRAKVVELVNWLRQEGIHCDYYHAGIPTIERNQKQEAWIKGIFPLMICTNAFGMGIDKPDVRYVIHYSPPNSLEAYYQEAGRAGRDEKPSICLLLWDEQDLKRDNLYFAQQYPSVDQIESVYESLGNYFQLALYSGQGHSFTFELSEFCSRFEFRPIE